MSISNRELVASGAGGGGGLDTTDIVTDYVELDIWIDVNQYAVTEMDTEISRYNETDIVNATIVDPEFSAEPSQDDEATVYINDEVVFSGFVNRVQFKQDGSFKVQILNDLYKVKNEEVTLSITEDPTPLSTVVADVCEQAGVDYDVNLTWSTDATRESGGRLVAIDYNIGIEETGTKAAEVLDKLAKWANADWWFDEWNTLQFGLPDSELHDVYYVKDTTAADKLPPYRGVKVVGDNVVSLEGFNVSHIPGYEPVIGKQGIFYNEDNGTWERSSGVTNDPVFTLKDKQIKTQEQAQQTAAKLADELFKQIKGGKVKIAGTRGDDRQDPANEIGKLDVIEMPERMGGERYFVGRINHKINSSNGYEVIIECEGLLPERYGVDPITVSNP